MIRRTLDKTFKERGVDVLFSASPYTRLWYSGINSTAGNLFIEPKSATLLIDNRYIEYARASAKNVEVINYAEYPAFDAKKQKQYKKIGVEADYITLSELANLKKRFPKAEIVELDGSRLRIIKSADESKLVRTAAEIGLKALDSIKNEIKPGISEKEIDAKLEYAIRTMGAEKGSFDAIVASGQRGALPHGRASEKVLQAGELVTIDFGAIYKGYCSDITRTFHVGKVTDKKLLEIEKVVKEAQKRGIEAVKPGVSTADIDKTCRDYITAKGYGKYFVHSTGHGLGIEVHEFPIVSSNAQHATILEPGMIITVEPGIYIEGFGGIRLEDDVLVTKTGYDVLSKLPKK